MEEKIKKRSGAEQLVNDKLAASKDGIVYMNDMEFRQLVAAVRAEQAEKTDAKGQASVGVSVDLKL
ncbi:MAG: hypothetical protein NC337_14145 [Roseburia sp.]|nr:hypothetical protein [Roseburia sp.]